MNEHERLAAALERMERGELDQVTVVIGNQTAVIARDKTVPVVASCPVFTLDELKAAQAADPAVTGKRLANLYNWKMAAGRAGLN